MRLHEQNGDLQLEVAKLKEELEQTREENAVLKQTAIDVGHEQPQSSERLHEIRDRVLRKLGLGKQAPGYRAALKALNEFITEFLKTTS